MGVRNITNGNDMNGNINYDQRKGRISMIANFLHDKFKDVSNFINLNQNHLICLMLARFSGVASKRVVSK